MKIVVIASYAQSLVNFRGPLLTTLSQAGHHVIACAPGEDLNVVKQLEAMGVKYFSVPIDRTGLNPISDLRLLLHLFRLFEDLTPDIVLSYTVKPVIYGSLAARLARVPKRFSIITGLGYAFIDLGETESLKRRYLSRLVRLLYRYALSVNERIFFQNPDDRALFVQLGLVRKANTFIVNGSGVDLEYFAESPVSIDPPVFLISGRLLRDKGIAEYVEAARIIKSRYSRAIFRILGWFDPNPASISEQQVEQWQMEGLIEYLGIAQDVRPHISACSVYVLPSYREGLPRSVVEAMAVGRPVITTTAPGCRETVINGENGFLVPVKDVPALVEAMERFIVDPDLIPKMGGRSRELAVERYDVHQVNKVLMRVMGLL